MRIQSIRCAVPCCVYAEEKQTKCSLLTRIAVVSFGGVTLLVGILALREVSNLRDLGIAGGNILTAIGSLMLLAGITLKCVSKKINDPAPVVAITPQPERKDKDKISPYAQSNQENTPKISDHEVLIIKDLMEKWFDLVMDILEKSPHPLGKAYLLTRNMDNADYNVLKESYQDKIKQIIHSINNVNYRKQGGEFYDLIDVPYKSLIYITDACSEEQRAEINLAQKRFVDFMWNLK